MRRRNTTKLLLSRKARFKLSLFTERRSAKNVVLATFNESMCLFIRKVQFNDDVPEYFEARFQTKKALAGAKSLEIKFSDDNIRGVLQLLSEKSATDEEVKQPANHEPNCVVALVSNKIGLQNLYAMF